MADKNNNGIPDAIERNYYSSSGSNKRSSARQGALPSGSKKGVGSTSRTPKPGSLGPGYKTGVASRAAAEGRVGSLPVGSSLGGRAPRPGGGRYFGGKQAGGFFEKQQPEMTDTALPSFLANLMEALGFVDGGGGVDYDPLRNDARSRGAEYDARLAAMYNQLQNAMRKDGEGIQSNYQGAIDENAARTLQAQQSIQAASDAAAERNLQQLQALGIGEAAGNIVAEGRDLNSDTARAVQEAAARGQIAGDNLSQNQQSALAHNTNLVGAAGLEGNLQRARVQSELGSLLAQYDMEEQQARQQVQQQSLSQAMSLASALTNDQWKQRGYQDDLSQFLAEQKAAQAQASQPNKLTQSLAFLEQLMTSPQFSDTSIQDLLPYIQAIGGIGKLV